MNELGIAAAEAAAGDALAAGGLSITLYTGGRIALHAGGEIVGLMDDATKQILRTTGDVINGKVVVKLPSGGVGYFDEASGLVLGNPNITGIIPDAGDISRLNVPDGSGTGLRPGEAEAGAVLEQALNVTLIRSSDGNVDFIISTGPNAGNTVDFLYAIDSNDATKISGINNNFANNWVVNNGPQQILNHLAKSNIAPLDLRNLIPSNQQIITNFVEGLPASMQSQIIFLRQ